ncbi:MAG: prolyl oligopeptidase family serine peptidase [Acidobacteria bacterium]|nr:prolyl oligopeptidase family serine peptidase [Acidobacteriota bacterium]
MCKRLTVLSLVLATVCGAFSLEQILSSPFPSSLVAAPAAGKIAWVQNARGVRNIWVAEPPDYKGRPVTVYKADDGQELLELRWTPDGRAIVYTRGGAPNRQGEYPNPRSDPAGVAQAVWVVTVSGDEPRQLGEGTSPAVSPKGDRVAFLRKGQIWSAPLDANGKASQLIHARGDCGALRWSPDGSKLAFVSNRRDHSFIGVYDLASKSLRYLDPSVDRDSNPVWSPDGQSIAFLRVVASRQIFLFGPKRSAEPWSIRIAGVGDGRGRQVWRAEEGKGSVLWPVVTENQLLWAAGDCLVFPWERDGWNHLYSISTQGGKAALLTPGEFEVEHVSLMPDGKQVLFSSNQGDIDRRHIWKVAVTGEPPAAVTTGSGIEWGPVATNDGKAVAFLRSDARRPARAAIAIGSGSPRDLAPDSMPADFPSSEMVEPQQVIFSGADGMRIHGQLFLPPKMAPGERHPAVVFFHGGSRRQMLLGWHYRDYYHNAYGMNQYLASRGTIVLAANYRSGTGYGMEFREALNYGARGASEFNDVLGAGLYLRSRPDVDPQRIGLWGGSYGGYRTAMGLAKASDLFAAGVDLHGVHDWNEGIRNFVPSYDPEADRDAARLAFESSPMAYVKTWRSPVLLIHGDDDRNVNFNQSVELAERLRKQGVPLEQLVFPDEIHGFLTHSRWLEAYHAAADFFNRYLESKK